MKWVKNWLKAKMNWVKNNCRLVKVYLLSDILILIQVSIKDDMTVVLVLEDEDYCNWTLFVRMAHSLLEQNSVVYKQGDQFYIITTSEIKEHEELLLWFSRDLCQQLGLYYVHTLQLSVTSRKV